ncbi:Dolichyl-phosphate-mannose-protein mannosyltransferase-domain-containing protein [Yarrowia lipolytica]|uniref:Dolichyl-phosphate-mannose--protein mannosyltransferase n=1 Tax=Yarrowia lipolytica (strain CLIB 122 / E 150) TaxID=284591 RepID=Q6C5U6_YARLI|nr:YALI0E15081p [Yarrowia lipolytica CLIB122]RDW41672.1 Dolichyl-phosphate-mannose-protein mannosyltransferase-domain-containing protein [Yarrowia lipolytica]RDW47042.1 Dolichyl-phosphate-mannose-protein mannosyltransferase-domain-containing protein [Yarrowia lipolytica]RDW54470.1 Dolichyl-phosphate-mannose-protein mannosyltransferase-domain-containing protein [Yarrowia lipolytica]CAG79559.1 YALI0E15081p [Yarrowia lipolytica CLIB122]|eukprot:XP_503966.1 YALI0E15081p [Yarrowia lipolytica CLIB122]
MSKGEKKTVQAVYAKSALEEMAPEVTPAPGYKNLSEERALTPKDRVLIFVVSFLAGYTRFRNIWQPSSVVFDEVHFGGFARKYVIGRFFMDVHPPLAKMLFAAVGWLAGYDGEFEFSSIGVDYLSSNVPYVAMRSYPAVLGVATVALAYLTLKASGCRTATCFFGAALLAIENSLVTESRYILLDSPLIFFLALTVYFFKKFELETPFTGAWYRYLFLSGLALGATTSVKWYGLFTIAWMGLMTLWHLWWTLGDLSVTPCSFTRHFGWRAAFLIGVPISFYVAMFAVHFLCLVNTGDGASFMSPEFQNTLQHSTLIGNQPADVLLGSKITLRHLNTQGGYLHSHESLYETGSKQQQVTLYPHSDQNNDFLVENYTVTEGDFQGDQIFLKDGDVIRLKHIATGRRIHSHDFRPPVSEADYQNEVSAYGYPGFDGDANDNFRVEIVKSKSQKGVSRDRVRTIDTKFRLIHTITGCALFSHSVKLPKWAFEQQEVTCAKSGTLPNSIWYIESNSHPTLVDSTDRASYRTPSFLSKFLELNKVMWTVNKGLTDPHTWESRPESWPFLQRGINFWVKDNRQVYLLGNAPIWWLTTLSIGIFLLWKAINLLRFQRGYNDFAGRPDLRAYDVQFTSFLLGWALHYFPSYLMARQLFLHHYLCSLYFVFLGFVCSWEYFTLRIVRNKIIGGALSVGVFAAALSFYVYYSPIIYGDPWTKSLCEKGKWLPGWDFDCNSFHESLDLYNEASILPVDEKVVDSVLDHSIAEAVEDAAEAVKASEAHISPHAAPPNQKVVYKDEEGNVLDPEEVAKMAEQGKVEFRKGE